MAGGSATAADPKPMPEQITVAPTTSGPMVVEGSAPVMGGYHDGEDNNSEGHGHLMGGAGILVLKPYPKSDTAITTTATRIVPPTFSAPGSQSVTTTTTDFDHSYQVTPLIWLGYVNCDGFGGRVRWWHFDEKNTVSVINPNTPVIGADGTVTTSVFATANPFGTPGIVSPNLGTNGAQIGDPDDVVNGTVPDRLTASEEIRLNVWDVEALHEFKWGCMTGLVSGGVRFAQLEQHFNASRVGFTGVVNTIDSAGEPVDPEQIFLNRDDLAVNHTFDGAGPTFSLEVRRPFGDSGLSLYGNARTSILFGKDKITTYKREQYVQNSPDIPPDDGSELITKNNTTLTSAHHDQVIPVVELELGAEWSKCMGNVTPFVRAATVAQSWIDAGGPTTDTGNFGLFGFTVQAGINY
jgi:hypothetical protein